MKVRRGWLKVGVVSLAVSSMVAGLGGVADAANTKPIVVGGIWTQSSFSGADVGAKAAFNAFNAAGGLDGRKIKFVGMQDDAASSAGSITAAKALVNQGVVAVVPVVSSAFDASSVLSKAQIPWFGWGVTPNFGESSYGFSFIGSDTDPNGKYAGDSVSPMCNAYAAKMHTKGCKGVTVAVVGEDENASKSSVLTHSGQWKKLGAKVVLQQTTMPGQPAVISDFSPYANQIMTSASGKPPAIVDAPVNPTQNIGLYSALSKQSYSGMFEGYTLYDPKAVAIAKGSYTQIQFAPWQQNTPAVAKMTSGVMAVSPTQAKSQAVEAGYISAQMFIAALKKAGPNFTGKSLAAAINKGWTFSIPGLAGSITYPAAHTRGGGGAAIVYSNGTAYTVASPITTYAPIPVQKS
jgi:ABC-type branched-subunit amino acid transport system substrate-binding protein